MIPPQPPPDLNETNWIVQVNESVRRMPSKSDEERFWEKRSIYRVPACITNLNSNAYWPQAVSFGPYHHGKDHLLPMEEHKHRALLHFLWRCRKPVEPFLKSLREVVQDLEDSYDMLDPKWKERGSEGAPGPFLKLMIIDGCFMLEILRSCVHTPNDYPPNDPIFGDLGCCYLVQNMRRDMLMLENQLPMLVLERLIAVESYDQPGHNCINTLILNFYPPSMDIESIDIASMGKCLHVLDVLKKSLLRHEKMANRVHSHLHDLGVEKGEEIISSATELIEAGIRLKKSKTNSLKDISFVDGVLMLPAIVVDDITESMFLNLMTFEGIHFGAGHEITDYIFFMDNIIDTVQDVALLRTQGIIQIVFGNNKVVVELFNSLTKDMTLIVSDCDGAETKKISDHCKKPWNMWRANLIHTYFRNPWSILSLIAAIFLFTLTIIQTVYTAVSYYK